MKHQFCGLYAVFEGVVQFLESEKPNPNRLKLSLLHRHILDVSEHVMTTGISRKRLHTVLSATNFGGIGLQYIMV
jgi:hypothetical protein